VVADVESARRTIAARLASNGIRAGEIKQIAPSLEDVFVARIRAAGGAPV
jgi:hypothetical protein